MDWLDWILTLVFIALLTGIGWLIQPKWGWIIGLVLAPFLLGLAKSKRDQARIIETRDEPPEK